MLEKETLDFTFKKVASLKGRKSIFKTPKEFREYLTLQKLEILVALSTFNPTSIYELAKLLERDNAAVQRDCAMLEEKEFITLESSGKSRGSKIPRLKSDFNKLVVHLPKMTYELSFKALKNTE